MKYLILALLISSQAQAISYSPDEQECDYQHFQHTTGTYVIDSSDPQDFDLICSDEYERVNESIDLNFLTNIF